MSNILHRAEITDVKSSNNQLHLRHTVSSSAKKKKKSKHSDLLNVLVIFLQTESPKHSHILKLLTRAMTETSSWKPTSTIGLQCSLNKEQTNNRGVSRLLWGPSHAAEWWRAQWCIQALTELELATGMYSHWMQRDCSLLLPKDNQFPFKNTSIPRVEINRNRIDPFWVTCLVIMNLKHINCFPGGSILQSNEEKSQWSSFSVAKY